MDLNTLFQIIDENMFYLRNPKAKVFGSNLNLISSYTCTIFTEVAQVLASTEHQTRKTPHSNSTINYNSQTHFAYLCILLVISNSLITDVSLPQKGE